MQPQLSQRPLALNPWTTGAMAPVTWSGKTATKNCAGVMPTGLQPLLLQVVMVPSWLLKLPQHLLQHLWLLQPPKLLQLLLQLQLLRPK